MSARSYACLYIWIRESSDLRFRPLLIQASLQMQGPTCPSHTRLASEASGQLTATLFGLRVSDSLSSPASPLLWLCTRDCPIKTSRLHHCDQGRAVGCSACGPMPVWGLTHGHDPGVSLWAGVAGLLRGRWLPAFFWCLLFVSFSRPWGGDVDFLYMPSTGRRPVTSHGVEGSDIIPYSRRGLCKRFPVALGV